VLWTDGSRDGNGAVGYAVAWRKGQSWAGSMAHMGYYKEAYDAECAPIGQLSTWQLIGPSGANPAEFGFSRMHRPRLNG